MTQVAISISWLLTLTEVVAAVGFVEEDLETEDKVGGGRHSYGRGGYRFTPQDVIDACTHITKS